MRSDHSSIDFASNDYLGLARCPLLKKRILTALEESAWKNGSTGSRLLTGNSSLAESLEEKIADFHGYEAGLLYNCGYMANIGILSSAPQHNDAIFFDTHVHASMHDGIKLSSASAYPFRHNDLNHLENRLKTVGRLCKQRFICIESLYSIDGTLAPLEEIATLSAKYGAHLIVDEAHAVGVQGPQGRGLIAEKKLSPFVFAQVVTFGKALGTFGAIVLGSRRLKEYLINFARSCIYTTALPPHNLIAIRSAYERLPQLDTERKHLQNLILLFSHSTSAIQPIKVQGNSRVKEIAQICQVRGFDVRAILSPTVQRGEECLRIILHAFNTKHEVQKLQRSINELL